ncbi:hypothetical protein [Chryseobacterium luquanense]|uniref:Uncharacterized protein n=1 Tax=Chryseobacterium luquanense TaxID=2983766 RepID=A0ABT3Y836_9FLAO|nr:hypothetical protein [Chryseobacterium luquanense]MCX8534325.1 hypothetical protein [Chryseobacterium luquanense]
MKNLLEIQLDKKLYLSKSSITVQNADKVYKNNIDQNFSINVKEKNDTGYIVEIEILDFSQSANDPYSILLSDIGRINKKMIFQTDSSMKLLKILNKKDMLDFWRYSLLSELSEKYKNPKYKTLFIHFENQLKDSGDLMEKSMKNKGFYDMIFNNLTNENFYGDNIKLEKSIENIFDDRPLPYTVESFTLEEYTLKGEDQKWIYGTGSLNHDDFDKDYLRKKIRRIIGNALFPVKPHFEYQEGYRISSTDSTLQEARQELKFRIDGYYYYTTRNAIQQIPM